MTQCDALVRNVPHAATVAAPSILEGTPGGPAAPANGATDLGPHTPRQEFVDLVMRLPLTTDQRLDLVTAMGCGARIDLTPADTHHSDLGLARRVVARFGANVRFCHTWGSWLVWTGRCWRRDDSGVTADLVKQTVMAIYNEALVKPDGSDARKNLLKFAMKSEGQRAQQAAMKLAESERAVAVTADQLNQNGWLLGVQNGIIDLTSGILRPALREDLITRCAPVTFDTGAQCPLWLRFLDRIMAGNKVLIAYLQRVAGMCLTADIREQALFIFHGQGANGKSVFLDTLIGLLGDYAGEAAPDLLIVRRNEEHACEVADLQGRRLVVCGETEQGTHLRVQLLKRLTGNKFLKARFMRENYFQFARTHKLILATNNKPVIREGTHAVWRRVRLVPFTIIIPDDEQDPLLTEKLKGEWSGILNWLVAGCLAWQATGLQTPEEVVDATQGYEDEQDLLGEFAEEILIFTPRAFITRGAAWTAYTQWGQDHREKRLLGRNEFYDALRRRPGVGDDRRRVEGRSPARGFTGVGLAPTLPGFTGPTEGAEDPPPWV